MQGAVYFAASDPLHGNELWRSDGTVAGTSLVFDICAGSCSSAPTNLTVMSGSLYFTAYDNATGVELWRSDGMAGGTALVSDILPGGGGSDPSRLRLLYGRLVFEAQDQSAATGRSTFVSDGTALGTFNSNNADLRTAVVSWQPVTTGIDGQPLPTIAGYRIYFGSSADDLNSVVEVNGRDRPGLLYDVTRALTECGLQITTAKISTFGERVVDVFYVKDVFGMKVEHERKQEQIKTRLLEALGGAEPARPAEVKAAE